MRIYSTDNHSVIHGDGLEALASIPSNSVNLVFVDPPYNIGKDFDGVPDRLDEDKYLTWCWQWIDENAGAIIHH